LIFEHLQNTMNLNTEVAAIIPACRRTGPPSPAERTARFSCDAGILNLAQKSTLPSGRQGCPPTTAGKDACCYNPRAGALPISVFGLKRRERRAPLASIFRRSILRAAIMPGLMLAVPGFAAPMTIANSDSLDQASFVVPSEPGKQIHIILEVTDNGTPPLTSHQRVICNIK
jgi:hypothetical protein